MKKISCFVILVLILSLMLLVLCACNPRTAYDAKEKLEKKGYEVEFLSADEISESFELDLDTDGGIFASKGDEGVIAIWFEDKEDAEEFVSLFKLVEKQYGAGLGLGDVESGSKGRIFFFGTEDAIEDLF